MTGAQNNDVVQTLPSYRSDQPLGVGILPRALRCREDLLDAQRLQPTADCISIDAIPVPNQVSWRFVVRESLDNLLCNPARCGLIGHIEVEHFPAAVLQY